MLLIDNIREAMEEFIEKYSIRKVSLFGSYAEGTAKEDSDIDLLVEFENPNISLFVLSDIREEIQLKLNKEVDLIHGPIEDNGLIKINKVIDIYEQ